MVRPAIEDVIALSELAGRSVMRHYSRKPGVVVLKKNLSPLTQADKASHRLILRKLKALTPRWPVLSEESVSVPYRIRKTWKTFWLVDPLDGTKEFLKQNGEFTVNIALVKNGKPVLGVVHVPAKKVTYFARQGEGAFKKNGSAPAKKIGVSGGHSRSLKVVVSRSHLGKETEDFLGRLGPFKSVSVGSSLKFCRVAEGRAHLYPRFWPSMEWDTAAAQCLVTEAGGSVTDLQKRPLRYNKRSLVNPYFIASARPPGAWKRLPSKRTRRGNKIP